MKDSDAEELKTLVNELPEIRWNITEKNEDGHYGYLGDEIDNIQHMSEEEVEEYFVTIARVFKQIVDKIESL